MVNVSNSLNNLKANVDGFEDLKKLRDVVDNGVVKNTKFSTLKTKANNLGTKLADATTLIRINQYSTNKQNL